MNEDFLKEISRILADMMAHDKNWIDRYKKETGKSPWQTTNSSGK